MSKKDKNRKKMRYTSIKGIVIPVHWDKKGNPVAFAISTHEEEDYLIKNDAKGKELQNFIQETVEASGLVTEIAGIKILTVMQLKNWKINENFTLGESRKKRY